MHANQRRKLDRLETEFTAAKAAEGSDPATYRKAKNALAAYRIKLRRERIEPIGDGDATAQPTSLQAKATDPVKE